MEPRATLKDLMKVTISNMQIRNGYDKVQNIFDETI